MSLITSAVLVFRGIRYATADRFGLPRPVAQSRVSGPRAPEPRAPEPRAPEPRAVVAEPRPDAEAAGQFGAPAPQRHGRMAWVPGLEIDPTTGREDCLSLNIWTPGTGGQTRPVLVFLHGGAFVFGSGAQSMYDGTALARDHGLVVVTVNYRLGVFGFLGSDLDDGIPANLGLRDQIAALRWVRDNIAAFGGDPRQVTLAGHSAGATSALALLSAPEAEGLFARAALMSAVPYGFATPEQAKEFAGALRHGLAGADPRTAHVSLLLEAEGAAITSRPPIGGILPVAPVIDGELLPRHPMDAVRAGEVARVPLLVTTTAEEMRLFAAIDPRTAPHAASRTEMIFERPAAEIERMHQAPVRRVRFTHRSPMVRSGIALGACHLVDVPFHLGTLHDRRVAPLTGAGPEINELGRRTTAEFAAFCQGADLSEGEK